MIKNADALGNAEFVSAKGGVENVQAQMSQVWQHEDSARLSPDALVTAFGWLLQSFVRSLQLVIQWIRIAGHAVEKIAVCPGFNAQNRRHFRRF